MKTEYEATFINIDKEDIRGRLKNANAKLIRPEFLQKRVTFGVPNGSYKHAWARVRDESDKITMSFKAVLGDKIEDQKEVILVIDSFKEGIRFLESLGYKRKSYQETRREIWDLDGVEVCIDEWPFLEPFVEIEGTTKDRVKKVSDKLGFDYNQAVFGPVGSAYSKKYNIPEDIINNHIPKIIFDMENPFLIKP